MKAFRGSYRKSAKAGSFGLGTFTDRGGSVERPRQVGKLVSVTCWCEENVVRIPLDDVGRTTRPCGLPDCQPPGPSRAD
jgi:hypothetical protein